jgi:predicted DsbA family dithiol-disulfide isomerase
MQVVHYTDPGCPFAFSSEPDRLRLAWTFGEQLQWTTRMIVLAEQPSDYSDKGMTPAKMAKGFAKLQAAHGMPIDTSERPRLAATIPSCRAVVAARLHRPELVDALLRALRVHVMDRDGMLDDPKLIATAAADSGLDPDQLATWAAEDATEQALREDMRAARRPLPAALALDHKLAPSNDGSGGRRYTAPSLELHAGEKIAVVPGFQPWSSYELTIANLDPSLTRRDSPDEVRALLEWAAYPLATVEVAAIMQLSTDEARAKLEADATFVPAGEDGYWTLDA